MALTELQVWANKRVQEHKAQMSLRAPPKVIARPQSSSNPKVKYMVTQYSNGDKVCNCPGFLYRRRCKHTMRYK